MEWISALSSVIAVTRAADIATFLSDATVWRLVRHKGFVAAVNGLPLLCCAAEWLVGEQACSILETACPSPAAIRNIAGMFPWIVRTGLLGYEMPRVHGNFSPCLGVLDTRLFPVVLNIRSVKQGISDQAAITDLRFY